MAQLGFFDADKRLEALSAKGDPLEAIDRLVPWESFRAEIEAVMLTPDELKKSSAGRKPFDAILMFRMLVLQALNNLSDEQVEYQVRDRLSFSRFLGLAIEDSIPDATTLWLFREKLAKSGLIKKLFERFDQHLAAKGFMARGGQIIDASIVPVPTQRNSRDENNQLSSAILGHENQRTQILGSRNGVHTLTMPTQTRTPDSGPRTDRGDAHLGWTEGPQRTDRLSLGRERDPIPYALETDWPVGAAGVELPHLE